MHLTDNEDTSKWIAMKKFVARVVAKTFAFAKAPELPHMPGVSSNVQQEFGESLQHVIDKVGSSADLGRNNCHSKFWRACRKLCATNVSPQF